MSGVPRLEVVITNPLSPYIKLVWRKPQRLRVTMTPGMVHAVGNAPRQNPAKGETPLLRLGKLLDPPVRPPQSLKPGQDRKELRLRRHHCHSHRNSGGTDNFVPSHTAGRMMYALDNAGLN